MKAKFGTSLGLLFFIALFAMSNGVMPVHAASATWTVNGALASDTSTCNATNRLCKTIQGAINAPAAAGDTINVLAGTYVENITVDKSLTLVGAGQNVTIIRPALSAPNPTGCSGSLCAGASHIILVQASDVTIAGFTLDGDNPNLTSGIVAGGADLDARNGIITNGNTGTAYNNLVVSNVTVKNIYLRGIYASSGGTFNFHNNTVANVQADQSSIAMFNYGGAGIFANNTVSGANDAISANHSKGTQFLNNIITVSSSGVHTDNAGDGGGTADVIKGNSISNCTTDGYGIFVFVAYIAPAVQSNKVINCAEGLSSWSNGSLGGGAVVPVTFTNNFVDGQNLANSVGIYATTSSISWGDSNNTVSFTNNVITRNAHGVETGVGGGKTLLLSLFYNNISGNTIGIDNTAGATVDASHNWWGSAAGPGLSGNNGTVGTVTTTPFATALVSSATASTHEIGETGVLTTSVTAAGLYGAQLLLTYDNSTLNWSNGITIPVSSKNWYWDIVQEPFITVASPVGKRLSGLNQAPHTTANLTGDAIAQWNYTCNAVGTSGLTYDTSLGALGTKLSDKNGLEIPSALTGDSITCVSATASMNGTIGLQGRLSNATPPAAWNGSVVTLACTSGGCMGSGPFVLFANQTGVYQLVKGDAGSGIALGTYTATALRRGYLSATKSVTIIAGTNTITPTPTLLGGDVNGDGVINILDLTAIGGQFGNLVTADTGPDINGDAVVNIFDLVLAGGNFGASSSTW